MKRYERIRYEVTPLAIWITLARPDQLNLVDDLLFEELGDAFVRARLDKEHSVVVLRGSGRVFSAGGDLGSDIAKQAASGFDDDFIVTMYQHVRAEYPVFDAIEQCPKTTIAALNGDAIGAGLDLALMCDLVLATRETKLGFAPGKWGLADAPAAGRLVARIGLTRAKDLLFTARPLRAKEARKVGLVCRVCDAEDFDDAVLTYVRDVLSTAPTARRLVKQIMHRSLPPLSPDEHFESAVGSEFQAGVRAFAAREPTPWSAPSVARHLLAPPPADAHTSTETNASVGIERPPSPGSASSNGADAASSFERLTPWRRAFERLLALQQRKQP